ncbi:saccharopine dehydrogenase NADP-binding domain-containing protein [Pseudonocardia endophytica]|uniref:saccharopine dehydrogenase NADP-binding domain-containing protein n=1 Tax=Pseudonocardia endophytica TaxID=401976 RepID=UPI0014043569|nr:saccharopine dehydrogenase NADP-binding domain-containing protein [Pseudonocardia endophytica]
MTSRRAAVLGSPIAHSLSPVLHRAAYASLGLAGWSYDAHEVDEAGLAGFVAGLGPEWAGLSLTMPLKRVALEVADRAADTAAAIGAANTLVPEPDGWRASNTDVTGLVVALSRARAGSATAGGATAGFATAGSEPTGCVAGSGRSGWGDGAPGSVAADHTAGSLTAGGAAGRDGGAVPPSPTDRAVGASPASPGRAVVLGAGGTAQAALAALRELGVDDVTVLVRDAGRADALRDTASRLGVSPTIAPVLTDAVAAARVLDGADVVISTLPAGAADELAGARWRPGVTLLDAVYAPWPTAIAAGAAASGATIVSGLEMLLHQAIAQVELMTGHPGPEPAMRAALDEAVLARG